MSENIKPSVTVDTPEFRALTDRLINGEIMPARGELIAHIDAHTAQAVADARSERDEATRSQQVANGGLSALVDYFKARAEKAEAALPAQQQPAQAALSEVREAVLTYYDALTARQPGVMAQDKAFNAIQKTLGLSWKFGVDHRAASKQPAVALAEDASDSYVQGRADGLAEAAKICGAELEYPGETAGIDGALHAAIAAILAAQQPSAAIPDQTGDIFNLIREWAHLPEGQRGDVARKIIWQLNKSYMAGVNDTRELVKAQQPSAEPFMYAIAGPDGSAHIDENCVGSDEPSLYLELNGLNDSPDAGYRIVPVFLSAPPAHAQQDDGELPELTMSVYGTRTALDLERQRRADIATRQPAQQQREHVEQMQRERMAQIFAGRKTTPATADFDLPAPNDAVEQDDGELPALPDFISRHHNTSGILELYSADQMREYGRLCRAARQPVQQGAKQISAVGYMNSAFLKERSSEFDQNGTVIFRYAVGECTTPVYLTTMQDAKPLTDDIHEALDQAVAGQGSYGKNYDGNKLAASIRAILEAAKGGAK